MNKPLVVFGIDIGMLILGVGTSFCCIPTLGLSIPTAAPAGAQPTPLVLPSLALPAPYPLAHTFDTTSTSRL